MLSGLHFVLVWCCVQRADGQGMLAAGSPPERWTDSALRERRCRYVCVFGNRRCSHAGAPRVLGGFLGAPLPANIIPSRPRAWPAFLEHSTARQLPPAESRAAGAG